MCNPSFNLGAIVSNVELIIFDDILVEILARFFDAFANILFFNWGVEFLKSFNAFWTSPLILVIADLAPDVSPKVTVVPNTVLATFWISPVASSIFLAVSVSNCLLEGLDNLFWSPDSLCAILSFGLILLVYPV